MIVKNINNVMNSILDPFMGDVQKAQQASIERIRRALFKAEKEVVDKVESMNPDQRLQAAEQELDKAQEHMLSVVTSLYKSLLYLAPPASLWVGKSVDGAKFTVSSIDEFVRNKSGRTVKVEKEIVGEVVE